MAAIPSLRHLRAFQAVARLGSVGRASDSIHVTQPAVTQAIAKLEAQLGGSLLDRRPTGSFPNETGRIFLRRVDRMFALMDDALGRTLAGTGKTPRNLVTNTHLRSLIVLANPFVTSVERAEVSQATLVRSIRELERILGVPLIRTAASGLELTSQGAEFGRRLSLAVRELDYAATEIALARKRLGATLALGVLPMSGSYAVAEAVDVLAARHPGCQIRIIEGTYLNLLTCLRSGEVDMTFGAIRKPDWATDVTEVQLYNDTFCIIVRRDHPLTRLARITRGDLAKYEWIVPSPGAPRRTAIDSFFKDAEPRIGHAIETSSIPMICALVAGSDRISVLSQNEIELDSRTRLLSVLPVPIGMPTAKGVTMRSDWLPTALHSEFIDLLRSHTSAHEGELGSQLPPKHPKAALP
jgi:LysR family transcriptional regulator of gallate degradation